MDYATDPTLYRNLKNPLTWLIILFEFPSQVVFRTSLFILPHSSLSGTSVFLCSCSSDLTSVEWMWNSLSLFHCILFVFVNIDLNKTKRQRPPLNKTKDETSQQENNLFHQNLASVSHPFTLFHRVGFVKLCSAALKSFDVECTWVTHADPDDFGGRDLPQVTLVGPYEGRSGCRDWRIVVGIGGKLSDGKSGEKKRKRGNIMGCCFIFVFWCGIWWV